MAFFEGDPGLLTLSCSIYKLSLCLQYVPLVARASY
jgi:hypothetical protein